MKYYFLLFLFFFSGSCKSSQNIPTEDWLVMKRTACLGTCPVYEVKIDAAGNVVYKGVEYVPYIGEKKFKLTQEDLQQLQQMVRKADLFKYKDKYYDNITDLPTTYITYYEGERKKEIMDYYGAPASVRAFEKKLQEIIFRYLE